MTRIVNYLAVLAFGLLLPCALLAQQAAPAAEKSAAPKAAGASIAAPGWNNPPAWSAVESSPQYASLPGHETNVLVQDSGRRWRELRNGPVTFYMGWLLVIAPALLILFYFVKGPFKLHEKPGGHLIERFNSAERVAHWTLAVSFVVLALSGLMLLFGKFILLPLMGGSAYSWIGALSKNLHNFIGPLFIFSTVVVFVIYAKDNFLDAIDFTWLSKFGGLLSGKEVPSGRFNGGEKMWFWLGVALLGIVMSITGLIMLFPNFDTTRELMTTTNLVHAIAACLFIAMSLGHIYMSYATEGAMQGMREGTVDEVWARQHHPLWYNEVKAGRHGGKTAGATPLPAGND